MTLPDAVAVLNERKHNCYSEWKVITGPDHDPYAQGECYGDYLDDRDYSDLTFFEAIAIAEKYVREPLRGAVLKYDDPFGPATEEAKP